MSAKELGTLVVVVLKAVSQTSTSTLLKSIQVGEARCTNVITMKKRNLPDKHTFTKQDPYTVVQLGNVKEQTEIDKRGGQHPVWCAHVYLFLSCFCPNDYIGLY